MKTGQSLGSIAPRFAMRDASPPHFSQTSDPGTVMRLSKIENRAARLKDMVKRQYQRNEDSWTAKEAIALWRKHSNAVARLPAPPGYQNDVAPERLMNQARRIVKARAMARMMKINEIKNRMGNALIRNQPDNAPSQSLDRSFRLAAGPKRKQSMKI
jgi:hypothetical protein